MTSPENDGRRSATDRPVDSNWPTVTKTAPHQDDMDGASRATWQRREELISVGLRRRRDAALRLPALADGRHDPLSLRGDEGWCLVGARAAWSHLKTAGLTSEVVLQVLRGAA